MGHCESAMGHCESAKVSACPVLLQADLESWVPHYIMPRETAPATVRVEATERVGGWC